MLKHTKRACVYVDGSNFFHYCKSLGIGAYPKFDFDKFIVDLADQYEVTSKNYYIGAVRAKPDDKLVMAMMKKQMAFFSYLKKNNWNIKKGYLLKSNDKMHEKGVDVKMALDIALGAVDDKYDVAIIVSSDTDLLPALEQAVKRGKEVEYIGFSHRPSLAMIAKSDIRRLLTKQDLMKYII